MIVSISCSIELHYSLHMISLLKTEHEIIRCKNYCNYIEVVINSLKVDTHTHTHKHTHTDTHICTHIHTRTHTYVHTYTHTHLLNSLNNTCDLQLSGIAYRSSCFSSRLYPVHINESNQLEWTNVTEISYESMSTYCSSSFFTGIIFHE